MTLGEEVHEKDILGVADRRRTFSVEMTGKRQMRRSGH